MVFVFVLMDLLDSVVNAEGKIITITMHLFNYYQWTRMFCCTLDILYRCSSAQYYMHHQPYG